MMPAPARFICLPLLLLGFFVAVPADLPGPHHSDAAYSAAGTSQFPVLTIRGETPVKGSVPSAGVLPDASRSGESFIALFMPVPGYQPSIRRVHAFPRFSRGTFF